MSDCCTGSIINIGCFSHCATVLTGLTADATGTYRISLVPGGGYLDLSLTSGDLINFSAQYLNEDGTTIFKIIDPSGNYVTSGSSNCFRANIKPGLLLTDVST